MPILNLVPLAFAASLAAPADAGQATIQTLAGVPKKAVTAEAIPSPKLTQMRLVFDTAGTPHIVCREVANPAYKDALRNARKQAEAGQ